MREDTCVVRSAKGVSKPATNEYTKSSYDRQMFSRRFALLGIDLLSLDCDEKLTLIQRSPHCETVLSVSDRGKSVYLDTAIVEKIAGVGVSVAPNFCKLILSPHIREVPPKISCTFTPNVRRSPDVEVQFVPYRTAITHCKVCAGVSDGARDCLVSLRQRLPIRETLAFEFDFAWQLHHSPAVSMLARIRNLALFGLYGNGKRKVKAQLKFEHFSAFYEFGRSQKEVLERKCGLVFASQGCELGACLDVEKGAIKLKSAMIGASWGLASMTRLDESGLAADIGGELKWRSMRLRCLAGSDGRGVVEAKTRIGKKGTLKVCEKYENDGFLIGAQLKFDHR